MTIYKSWEDTILFLRESKNECSLIKDAFFDDPLISAAERYYKSSEWKAVKNYLPKPTGKALDLGAGRGISSYALASDGWDTIALEPDKSEIVGVGAIRQLKYETGLSIDIVEDYGENLPFNDETFSLVYCRQVLHHANNLKKLCHEIGRVLKPQGVFIATTESMFSAEKKIWLNF